MKVYVVWYECDLGRNIWSIFSNEAKALAAIKMIKKDFGYKAWYNDEKVF